MNIDDNSLIIGEHKSKEFIDKAIASYFWFYFDKKSIIETNTEIISLYDIFIDKCAKLIKELGISNNSLTTAIVLENIISLGILSNSNKDFNYGYVDKEIKYFEGINIIKGEGVCRNFSNLTKDIMERLNLYVENVWCSAFNKLNNTNHTINLIKYKDIIYGYDLYNHILFHFINSTDLVSLYNTPFTICRLTLLKYLTYDGMSENNLLLKLKEFESSSKACLSIEEYQQILNDADNLIDDNSNLLYDFTIDTKETKEKIIKLLK